MSDKKEPAGGPTPDVETCSSHEVKLANSKKVDLAAAFLVSNEGCEPLTLEEERRMVRKIDWIIVPMLSIMATLGAVDKLALSTAAIYDFRQGTHLVGQEYSWLGSILPLGAMIGMAPSTYLLHKLPSTKYLCACSMGWSTMCLLLTVCKNWSGLMAVRFFMGCFEAIIIPGISSLLAGFYKKSEQPPRNALVFACTSSIINGFLAWVVGHIPESNPLARWQYLFLIVGSISAAWSIFSFILLPDSPMNAFFLSTREKHHAVHRLAENKTGVVNKNWKWYQVREAFMDPKTWLLFFFNIAVNIPNGGLTIFGSILINNLGFSAVNASLLSMPTGVVSTLAAFVFSTIAARWHNRRCLTTMISLVVPIIGTIVSYSLPRSNVAGLMVGFYLLYSYFGPYVVGISLAQANTAGHTKKNVQYSILYVGYAAGNLIGPQTFRDSQAPAYTGGTIAMLVCYCVAMALMAGYWAVAAAQNKARDRVSAGQPATGGDVLENFLDETDWQQRNFRYTT